MKNSSISSTYMKAYIQCLQKFYFRYFTDKKPTMSGDARPFGIAVHEALEAMYGRLSKKAGTPTKEDYDFVLTEFISSGLRNNLSDQGLYEEGKHILKKRLDSYDPSEKVIGLELRFGWPRENPKIKVSTSKGTPLNGAIDKVFELDKDTIVVVDYKTSRTAMTDKEAAVDEQMSLYDLAVSKMYPQYKNIIMVIDYLRLGPVVTHRTEEQRAWFESILDEVYVQVGNLTDDDIRPRLNEFCGWCDHKGYCSSYQKNINDPDLLVAPLETMEDVDFVQEWVRFNNLRRIVEGYKRSLSMHATNMAREEGAEEIVGPEHTLYKVQSSRVYYDVKTVLNTIPKNDLVGMMSVNKSALDKYLVDHPEYVNNINETAKVSFASSFFKFKKSKK